MNRRILLVEDDEVTAKKQTVLLEQNGFQVNHVSTLEGAREAVQSKIYSLVVLDVHLPDGDGTELIEIIHRGEFSPAVILQSVSEDHDHIVPAMREGAIDYLFKPVTNEKLLKVVSKIVQFSNGQMLLKVLKKASGNQKSDGNLSDAHAKHSLINGLRNSLSQGPGFGTRQTLLNLMKQTVKPQNGKVIIPETMYDLLVGNTEIAERVIEQLEFIEITLNMPTPLEPIAVSEYQNEIKRVVSEVNSEAAIDNREIIFIEEESLPDFLTVSVDIISLEMGLKELIYNALKFSVPNSKIYILHQIADTDLYNEIGYSSVISILNIPVEDVYGNHGIQKADQSVIFDPFVRLMGTVHENIPTLDFGLGLTLVDAIIKNHHGVVVGFNVDVELDIFETNLLVNFEIRLPVKKIKKND